MPANELLPNPKNWRTHGRKQTEAMRGVLREIGFADAVLARETTEGMMLIDGHLRKDMAHDEEIPVLVVDLSEAEADKLLATHDPLAAMAEIDTAALDGLLVDVQTGEESVADMLGDLAEQAGLYEDPGDGALNPISTRPPPKLTWVLIGIPTVRFGEIAEEMAMIAQLPDVFCETTANDG